MELDKILTDLKIIEQLKEKDKLAVIVELGSKSIIIDQNWKLSSIIRWFYN